LSISSFISILSFIITTPNQIKEHISHVLTQPIDGSQSKVKSYSISVQKISLLQDFQNSNQLPIAAYMLRNTDSNNGGGKTAHVQGNTGTTRLDLPSLVKTIPLLIPDWFQNILFYDKSSLAIILKNIKRMRVKSVRSK